MSCWKGFLSQSAKYDQSELIICLLAFYHVPYSEPACVIWLIYASDSYPRYMVDPAPWTFAGFKIKLMLPNWIVEIGRVRWSKKYVHWPATAGKSSDMIHRVNRDDIQGSYLRMFV